MNLPHRHLLRYVVSIAVAGFAAIWHVQLVFATDPMRTALIVNENSIDSLTIANHYSSLRGIPDRNIVTLGDVPEGMKCSIEEMKNRILKPMLAELDRLGLGRQMDVIAYSAGFPTAISLDSDFAKVPKRHQLFTPVGSLNGITSLYQFLGDDQVSYVVPRANFYSRTDATGLQQNPFLAADGKTFNDAVAAAEKKEFATAISLLEPLIKTQPGQWPLRFRVAGYQALSSQTAESLETISGLLGENVAFRTMFEGDKSFDSIRNDEAFLKLLSAMSPIAPNRMPPVPFSGRIVWGQNGIPLVNVEGGEVIGPHYLLSVVLAVTEGRGTTLEEAIDILRRAAKADATGEPSTFYFSNSSNVRATTRMPLIPIAAIALRELGHNVIIDKDTLPRGQLKLMGAMLGSANYEWPLAANRLLPGSIADNLTSTSGVLHEENSQTSMVELLRGGAAGTSGTVTEPYALQFKFPTPLMYAYYATGATLAEAFYLSVECPYQLLIIGDPLCRPFGDENNELFSIEPPVSMPDTIELKLRFWRDFKLASTKLSRLEMYFGGQLALVSPPAQTIQIDKQGLPQGWHEITIIGVSQHPMETKTLESTYVLVGPKSNCPTIEANFDSLDAKGSSPNVSSPGQIRVRFQAPGRAERVALNHLGRRILETEDIEAEQILSIDKTGFGPVRLTPFVMRNGQWIPGKPITVEAKLDTKH